MDWKSHKKRVTDFLKAVYKKINALSGGVLEILRVAVERFTKERGSEASASLAYYALFSIFPMMIVFIVVGSFFVDRGEVQNQLLMLIQGIVPGAEEIVIRNIDQVLELRGAVTFIALVGLIWSATSVFNILVKNINRAFPKASVPDFFKGRLLGLLMILMLGSLTLLAFATSTLSNLLPAINIPLNGKTLHETFIWRIGAFLLPFGTSTLMFWAVYRWVPTVKVSHKASLIGALIAGIAWEILNNGFSWYLSSGLWQYRLVYGSVGTIVVFLFWIYLTATIVLLGAHLTASIQMAMMAKTDERAS